VQYFEIPYECRRARGLAQEIRAIERWRNASVIVPACIFLVWSLYDFSSFRSATRQSAVDRAAIAASYVERVLDAQSSVLDVMDQLIRDKSWSDIEGSPDIQEQLRDLDRRNPYTAVVAIIHPDGRIVASSLPQAVGGDISDREHLRAFNSGYRGLYVGPRQTLALSEIDTLVISRQARFGPPGAILVAPIPVAVVAEFFAAHAPHPRYVASLLRDDGWLLVRRDPTQQAIRIGEKEPAMVAIRGADSGLYEAKAVSDGIERIYAFVRIRDLPVVVNYGVARYAIWSDYGYRLALVLLLLGLLAALGVAMATHSLKQALAGESRRIELEEKVASRTADLRRLVAQKDLS
jgi:hypothetical protein